MSTSTIRTKIVPGAAAQREAAALREAMAAERRGVANLFVADNLAAFEARGGSDQAALCELTGRFEAYADLAPARLREETRALFESTADPAELAPRVERLEEEAGDRFQRRKTSEMSISEAAKAADRLAESPAWQPDGKLLVTILSADGKQRMQAEVSEHDLPGERAKEVAFDATVTNVGGSGSPRDDCLAQHRFVDDLVAPNDNMEMVTPPPQGWEEPRRRDSEETRSRAGESEREAG